MKPTLEQVLRFNHLKSVLLVWKHEDECLCNAKMPQGQRDELKREYEKLLEKFPNINDILPSFYCVICNPKE